MEMPERIHVMFLNGRLYADQELNCHEDGTGVCAEHVPQSRLTDAETELNKALELLERSLLRIDPACHGLIVEITASLAALLAVINHALEQERGS